VPLKIVHQNHYEIIGRGMVLLSNPAIHTQSPELYTGTLTEEVALISKGHAIIGKEKKLNDQTEVESAQSEFAIGVREFIVDHGIRLILEIRGKKEPGVGIEVETFPVEANEIVEIVKTAFALSFPVTMTQPGATERSQYANDKNVQTLVVVLGPDERGFQRESIIDITAETVGLINRKLGFLESEEGGRNVLD